MTWASIHDPPGVDLTTVNLSTPFTINLGNPPERAAVFIRGKKEKKGRTGLSCWARLCRVTGLLGIVHVQHISDLPKELHGSAHRAAGTVVPAGCRCVVQGIP